MSARLAALPRWLPPLALSVALVGALLIWDPQVRDLAAHVLRTELFERHGFAIWNGSWYGGHYTLTYSVLFPPLAAALTPQLVGALAAIASAFLFDALVRARWGPRAIWASLWFAVGAAAMFANGNLAFALGVAFGLAALLALQRRRGWLAALAALATGLASPVAAVFLAGIAAVVALVAREIRGWALGSAASALLPLAVLNLVFPEAGEQPFSFSSWIAVALWCAGALFVTRRAPGERGFRFALIGYAAAVTAVWLIPNPLGDNALRLASFFGGPLVLAIVLAQRPIRPGPATALVAVATLAWAAYWQVTDAVDELADATGDEATAASYYEPLKDWLRAHGGERARIEVAPTLNTWESAYVAPEFSLARGWLRQLDRVRDPLFFEDGLDADRYRSWLRRNGVRYVALADAPIHKYSLYERKLLWSEPSFLRPRWEDEHWRVWELPDPRPLVSSSDGGRARLTALGSQSFSLEVRRPGTFLVLVRASPYWEIASGSGCISEHGSWTEVRADEPEALTADVEFTLDAAWRSLRRSDREC